MGWISRRLLMAGLFGLVFACSTVGRTFDIERADNLVPGVSTVQDAHRELGEPTAVNSYADGSKLLQWQYSQGSLVGGSGAHVAILFDSSDRMIRTTQRFKI